MPPRSAKKGAAKKPSARSKRSNPSASDHSPAPPSPTSEEETTQAQDPEVTPTVGDEVSEVEAYCDSSMEDEVVDRGEDSPPPEAADEENILNMEEAGSASVKDEILESKEEEWTEKAPDAKKTTLYEPSGREESGNAKISQEPELMLVSQLENEETFKVDSLATSSAKEDGVVKVEKKMEDQDSIKPNEAVTPKEPFCPLSEELGTEKISQESELAPVSQLEDTDPSGTRDKMDMDELEDTDPSGTRDKMDMDEGFKQNVGEDKGNNKAAPAVSDNAADGVKGVYVYHDSTNDANEENKENEENDEEFYMQAALIEGKERKESEIFIGGLDKGTVEDDLVKVFNAFGDIQSVRIVKHPTTKKSRVFAYIGFSSNEHAMKALTELKDGIEVNGKRVRVKARHDNATLYLGNICKTWTRNHVIETLKSFGVEQMESMILPEDLKNEGKIKGFAFLDFSSHSDAMDAFQRFRKSDVFFGSDRSARVVFVSAPLHPSEEILSQIKTVHIEGIPLYWDEEKVQEICKAYGQIEKVLLLRNFSSSKRKCFGFVEFSSHESAVASVEGINNTQLGDGDANIRANLAKPLNKGLLTKKDDRGGFMINKDGEASQEGGHKKKKNKKKKTKSKVVKLKEGGHKKKKNKKKKTKSKVVKRKEETQLKLKKGIESKPSETGIKGPKGDTDSQREKSVKRKKRGRNDTDYAIHGPSKKMKMHHNHNNGKVHGHHSNSARNRKRSYPTNPEINFGSHLAYPARYPRRSTNSESYAYTAAFEPQLRHSDLEPHAGYLPAAKQVSTSYEYDLTRSGVYDREQRRISGFSRAIQETQISYAAYTEYTDYQPVGYRYPGTGAYAPRGRYY